MTTRQGKVINDEIRMKNGGKTSTNIVFSKEEAPTCTRRIVPNMSFAYNSPEGRRMDKLTRRVSKSIMAVNTCWAVITWLEANASMKVTKTTTLPAVRVNALLKLWRLVRRCSWLSSSLEYQEISDTGSWIHYLSITIVELANSPKQLQS